MREEEAVDGERLEAGEGEGSEWGLGRTLEAMDPEGQDEQAAHPGLQASLSGFCSCCKISSCMPPALPSVWFS